MDRRFPEQNQPWPRPPEWTNYPGQPQQRPPEWAGYARQAGEPEITQLPRFQEQPTRPERAVERRRERVPRVFLVWLLVAVLVAAGASSAVTVLVLRARSQPGQVGANPTSATSTASTPVATGQTATPAAAPTIPAGSLYTTAAGSLTRIDLQKNTTIWNIPVDDPSPPLIVGTRLFFNNEVSPGAFLEAASVDTGKQLWSSTKYGSGFLLGSDNMLYNAACDLTATSDPCHFYGINASTGAQLWSYDLPRGNAWIALQKGVLYGVSYTDYFALNAASGAQLWHQNIFRYTDQEANMTPVISGNVLSYASCNVTKQSRGASGCYLYAFNTANGAELWHMHTASTIMASPAIMDGVVYAGAIDGTLYAVSEQSGAKLWSANVGGTVGQVLAAAGMIYVEVIGADGQTAQIEALNASTHKPLWGQSQSGNSALKRIPGEPAPLSAAAPGAPSLPFSGGPSSHPFVFSQGLIYLHDSPTTISVLNARDGSTITQYTVNSIYGFTVVTA